MKGICVLFGVLCVAWLTGCSNDASVTGYPREEVSIPISMDNTTDIGMPTASALSYNYTSLSTAPKTHLFMLSGQSNMANMDEKVSFTPALKKAFPNDDIIVVKVAYGGRPIRQWVPHGAIYKELMAVVTAQTKGKTINTATFVWMQGEKDHQEDSTTRVYEQRLRTLYQQLLDDLNRKDINWVIGRLNDASMENENWVTIRQIQMKVANSIERAVWVNRDDLNGMADAVHNTDEGYVIQGERFAKAAIDLINSGLSVGVLEPWKMYE